MSNKSKNTGPLQLTTDTETEHESVELFRIDDTPYTVQRRPRVNVSLRYLKMARTQGQETAIAYLLEAMLGEDGYEALCNYDDLTPEQFETVVKAAQDIALGGFNGPKG